MACWLVVLCLLSLVHSSESLSSKDYRRVISTPGDIIIGGLCPLHYPLAQEQKPNKEDSCEGHFSFRGLQHAEAILYPVDQINQSPELLPGIKLGVEIRDTCNSVQFSFLKQAYRRVEGFQCIGKDPTALNSTRKTVAIVGAAYSGITMAVTSLAGLFYIPVVSYASTSRLLEDRSRFKYFLRTVPSDNLQAEAMVAIIKEFQWNYVSTIASDTEYGRSGIDAFRTSVSKLNYSICTVVNALFTTRTSKSTLKQIIQNLHDHPTARGIVLFAELNDAEYFYY